MVGRPSIASSRTEIRKYSKSLVILGIGGGIFELYKTKGTPTDASYYTQTATDCLELY